MNKTQIALQKLLEWIDTNTLVITDNRRGTHSTVLEADDVKEKINKLLEDERDQIEGAWYAGASGHDILLGGSSYYKNKYNNNG